jgi:hypothetical protein
MAKKKTAKQEAPVTDDVVEEYDATRYTPWVPGNMPAGGKANSTEQLNDHPTEHNHSAEAISDIVDRFADLRLYVPAANSCGVDGDLQVDGAASIGYGKNLTLKGNWDGARIYNSKTDNREILVLGNTANNGAQLNLYGDNGFDTGHARIYTGGTEALNIDKDQNARLRAALRVDGQINAQNGTKSAPAYSFTSDTDLGFRRPGTNAIEFVGNGKRLMQIGIDAGTETGAWMPTISLRTVTTAGNVYVDTNAAQEGALYRSTASRAFMQEIEAVNLDATNSVYDLAPIWFRSKCDADKLEHSHYGLAAEDCAAVDPRLAIMATDADGVETADNVNTNAVIALLVSAVQEQRATISDLTARVEALEANA